MIDGSNCGSKCGWVLVLGGGYGDASDPEAARTAEFYNPATGKWKVEILNQDLGRIPDGGLVTATVLRSGKVLFVGSRAGDGVGDPFFYSILYDPISGSWTNNAQMRAGRRYGHIATLLWDESCMSAAPSAYCGKVLVAGGQGTLNPAFFPLPANIRSSMVAGETAELYDPERNQWEATTQMPMVVSNADSAVLSSGIVLVAGGFIPGNDQIMTWQRSKKSLLYDPRTSTWSLTSDLNRSRSLEYSELAFPSPQPATRSRYLAALPDGRVLAAGGTPEREIEVYTPGPGFTGSWKFGPKHLNDSRTNTDLTLLACDPARGPVNGRVFIAGGGFRNNPNNPPSSELYDRVPTIREIEPSELLADQNSRIRLTGEGLAPGGSASTNPLAPTPAVRVNVGGVEAMVESSTDEEIVALLPPGPVGVARIEVTIDGFLAEPCFDPFIRFIPPPPSPNIRITPDRGPITGGTSINISGTGFPPGSTIKFGERAATDTKVGPDGTKIDAVAPAGDQTGPVAVTVIPSSLSTSFTYLPAITALSPSSGGSEGGTRVDVIGKGLAGANKVFFDSGPAEIISVTDDKVTVRTPPHVPAQVRVTLKTSDLLASVPVPDLANLFSYGSQVAVSAINEAEDATGADVTGSGARARALGPPYSMTGGGPLPPLTSPPGGTTQPVMTTGTQSVAAKAPGIAPPLVTLPGTVHIPAGGAAVLREADARGAPAREFAMVGRTTGGDVASVAFAVGALFLCVICCMAPAFYAQGNVPGPKAQEARAL